MQCNETIFVVVWEIKFKIYTGYVNISVNKRDTCSDDVREAGRLFALLSYADSMNIW